VQLNEWLGLCESHGCFDTRHPVFVNESWFWLSRFFTTQPDHGRELSRFCCNVSISFCGRSAMRSWERKCSTIATRIPWLLRGYRKLVNCALLIRGCKHCARAFSIDRLAWSRTNITDNKEKTNFNAYSLDLKRETTTVENQSYGDKTFKCAFTRVFCFTVRILFHDKTNRNIF